MKQRWVLFCHSTFLCDSARTILVCNFIGIFVHHARPSKLLHWDSLLDNRSIPDVCSIISIPSGLSQYHHLVILTLRGFSWNDSRIKSMYHFGSRVYEMLHLLLNIEKYLRIATSSLCYYVWPSYISLYQTVICFAVYALRLSTIQHPYVKIQKDVFVVIHFGNVPIGYERIRN